MKEKIFLCMLGILLYNSLTAQAPLTLNSCTFDNYNKGNTSGMLVTQRSTPTVALVAPNRLPVDIIFGQNASESATGWNMFEAGNINLTNISGANLSAVLVSANSFAFWSQELNVDFQYFTWSQSNQSWSRTVDGKTYEFKIFGASINEIPVAASQIQLMPVVNATTFGAGSGYNFAAIPSSYTATFSDNPVINGPGTGTHNATGSISLPSSIPFVNLGPLATGATFTNLRWLIGLRISGATGTSANTWVDSYSDGPAGSATGESNTGDYDYYVQYEGDIFGIPYDNADGVISTGNATHAYGLCQNALFIGNSRVDYETSVTRDATASGDNSSTNGIPNTYNDEDITALTYDGSQTTYTLAVPYTNNTGAPATISAWIDWNNNGIYDAGERAFATVPAGEGTQNLIWRKSGAATGEGTLPATVASTATGLPARIRIASNASEVTSATGVATNGEVEDLLVPVTNALAVKFGLLNATIVDGELVINWSTTSENDNDRFVIEVSSDGTRFKQIDTVKSKAVNGYSNNVLLYNYKISTNLGLFGIYGLAILGLGAAAARRKKAFLLIPIITQISLIACNKNEGNIIDKSDHLFIRIGTVDKNEKTVYSKIIAVSE